MEQTAGTITRRMDNVLYDLEKEFQSLCTIDDFVAQIESLKKRDQIDQAS